MDCAFARYVRRLGDTVTIFQRRTTTMSSPMDCPRCSQDDVLEIEHVLPDGTDVVFFWCHNCEEKWWNKEGVDIDVTQVLEMVRQARS